MAKAPLRVAPEPAAGASGLARRRTAARADGSEEYQERRRLLVAAAAAVFHRKGFTDTSLKDIAAEAGTDRATLYYYVTSKQELFVEVIKGSLESSVRAGEAVLASSAASTEKLRELLRTSMRAYVEHFPYLYVYAQEDLSRLDVPTEWQADLAALAQRNFDIIREVVVAGLNDGSFASSLSPGVIAQTMIGAVARSSAWFRPGPGVDAEALADGLSVLLVDGLGARPAGRRGR